MMIWKIFVPVFSFVWWKSSIRLFLTSLAWEGIIEEFANVGLDWETSPQSPWFAGDHNGFFSYEHFKEDLIISFKQGNYRSFWSKIKILCGVEMTAFGLFVYISLIIFSFFVASFQHGQK